MRILVRNFMLHSAAIVAAIAYGTQIAFGPFATTGLMFVTPVLVMLTVYALHNAWRNAGKLNAERIFNDLALGGTVLSSGVLLLFVTMPTPSLAKDNSEKIFGFLTCLAILVIIVLIIVWLIVTLFRFLIWLFFAGNGNGKRPDNNDINSPVAVVAVFAALGVLSLEGTPIGFVFFPEDEVRAQIDIAATPEDVWNAMNTSSSPDIQLPFLLSMLPHPVSIVDEGASVDAERVVHFAGREGSGDMVLVARPRFGNSQSWHVTKDTTPLRMWAELRTVTYLVEATPHGTKLTVTGDYLRHLAPAWFFKPYMNIVIGEAMSVLARDKHDRALVISQLLR